MKEACMPVITDRHSSW